MKHYYTNNQDLISEQTSFTFTYKGVELNFTSDNGVFSKTMIDFGSRVMLDAVLVNDNDKVLDVGCGYGTFGICLKKLNSTISVDMVDVNERAIDLTKLNAQNNGVEVNSFYSHIYQNVTDTYNVILTNPPIRAGKEVVTEILVKSYEHLVVGGTIWVVIQKKQGAPSAKKKLEEIFGNCTVVKKDKGYYILMSQK